VKVLAVSDKVVEGIYSSSIQERYGDVDIVLSCGDLPYSYLEYITSTLNVPCFFVHGNHDKPEYMANGCTLLKPGGWTNLDSKTVIVKDTILGGLEGSIRYKPEGEHQYTEQEMALKIWRMVPTLMMNRARYGRYLDMLITHAPPLGIHDGEDLCHRGFKSLIWFMERFRPRYLLHGHRHIYKPENRQTRYLDTEVINVYPYHIVEC
jgi:Icc-related predicted phosphoesterase